jgi:hypothetical protein
MVADEVDYVVGVDTHRDEHVLAVVVAPAGAVVAQQAVPASARGYAQALRFGQRHAAGARVWAVEGAGHYRLGLARYLNERGEAVLEVGRSHGASGACAARTTSSTPSAPRVPCSRASRWRCRGRDSAAKHCGCCWSPDGAPSMSVARRSCSCAASS